jgi:hypothetical protein
MNTIKINNVEYPIRYGLKAELRLEQEKGVTFGVDQLGTEASMYLHYFALVCAAEKVGQPLTISYNEFIDACDEDRNLITQLNELLIASYAEKKNTP